MARWNKTCKEFKESRNLIEIGDTYGIIDGLIKISEKYAKQKWDFAESFEQLADELRTALEDGEFDDEDDDIADYYLDEFYDLCDYSRVWLGL